MAGICKLEMYWYMSASAAAQVLAVSMKPYCAGLKAQPRGVPRTSRASCI